ncbi:MAG: cyclic pyranopterin monophosphate synthase MoaC [Candidatus Methanomethylicota archaeon]|jgi:cyclic pyranopterin phosphate synthase|uniref:Cyclic pyranopterin monophosphate synthase MoaC n=1 Tax=Thermoproteota archaeon TaxID=2056631 RepID=A0A520KGB9_9CREN|nr:MAG: cyclic pyranopterin monophosphate synthase MoaC [Candidatus Verstraetearchaeota archaeon]TDA39240.1 MAG: cyclic pyranopterin monophosphate synthase MoaC [Candidatus Verstraetearchaeota archaeon]
MVDISHKEIVMREAKAIGKIILKKETIELIKKNAIEKGDVVTIAKIAAIQAIKHTSEIIPLCHPIPIEHISIEFNIKENEIEVLSLVRTNAKTGVEMEALTGASVALLTIWDMVKKYEKDEKGQYPNTLIKEIRVIEKSKW